MRTLLSPEDHDDTNSDTEETPEAAADGDETNFTEVKRKKAKQRDERQQKCMQKALEEQREEETLIEKKKDNLIIYGMPETNTDDKEEELLEDYEKLKKVYEGKVNVAEEDFTHMTRIGKKETNHTRPIQITLANQEKRKELLTKNMNLKLKVNNESTPIYVSTDRTKKQREDFKKLREELKKKNTH